MYDLQEIPPKNGTHYLRVIQQRKCGKWWFPDERYLGPRIVPRNLAYIWRKMFFRRGGKTL